MGIPVKLEDVVVCFPHLVEAHAAPGSDRKYFSVEVLLDPQKHAKSLQQLEAAFRQIVAEENKTQFVDQMPRPYKLGETVNAERGAKGKGSRPELVGKWTMRASRFEGQGPPPVADQNGQLYDGGKIFAGCRCYVFADLYYSSLASNPGVFCGLNGVQLVTDVGVERLGSTGPTPEQMFQPIPGAPAPVQPVAAPATPAAPVQPVATPAGDTPTWAR